MRLFRFFQALRNHIRSIWHTGRSPYGAILAIQQVLDVGSRGKLRETWICYEYGEWLYKEELETEVEEALYELERGEVTEVTQEDWDFLRHRIEERRKDEERNNYGG